MILCWAAFIAFLGCMWPAGHRMDTHADNLIHHTASYLQGLAANMTKFRVLISSFKGPSHLREHSCTVGGNADWLQPLWKTVWCFFKKLKMKLPYDPEIPLLGIYPKKPKH